jgi:hypothetical protein
MHGFGMGSVIIFAVSKQGFRESGGGETAE